MVGKPKRNFVLDEFIVGEKNDEIDLECRWCELPGNITTERIMEVA